MIPLRVSSKRIRLIVADDHALVREGLVALLEDETDMEVVGQAENGDEALRLARKHYPDVALLDITMPKGSGLDVAAQISRELPTIKTLIVTMHEEEAFFFAALRAGAAAYVLKGADSEELFSAIRAVHQRGVYLSPKLAGSIVRDYLEHHPDIPLEGVLTPREQEILALIAHGLSNATISKRLGLSLNTVKTHRKRIYQKLHLNDRAQVVAYAIRRGILHP